MFALNGTLLNGAIVQTHHKMHNFARTAHLIAAKAKALQTNAHLQQHLKKLYSSRDTAKPPDTDPPPESPRSDRADVGDRGENGPKHDIPGGVDGMDMTQEEIDRLYEEEAEPTFFK